MSILDDILTAKRARVRDQKKERPWSALEQAPLFREQRRSLAQALRRPATGATPGGSSSSLSGQGAPESPAGAPIRFLCEIKRASPSAGPIRLHADAGEVARSYVKAGASGLSVVTEERFFRGRLEDLATARAAGVAVLMKDFVIDPYQLALGRALGADAALLIAAVEDRPLFAEIRSAARELSLELLVEVHALREIDQAVLLEPELIGVNNRDLQSFQVDLSTSERLFAHLPSTAVRLSESGIRSRAEVERLERCGFDALLVGESLMRTEDPGGALLELRGIDPQARAREDRSEGHRL